MDLVKQYIVQSITAAASNLRLNNQRIEVVAMLKEVISKSKDIQQDLNKMKKITELSKFAIKLSEIHFYLNEGSLDFLKVTEKFKEHSFNLIKEINHVLDMVNPYTFRETIDRIIEPEKKFIEIVIENENSDGDKSGNGMAQENYDKEKDTILSAQENTVSILIDRNEDSSELESFNGFETIILKPIKSVDEILSKINSENEVPTEIEDYSKLMQVNAELSSHNGFDILAQMHEIVSDGLTHIKNGTLNPSREVIESLRACLIVIVAVVKSKEVDIKNYLNRAEVFGKFLQRIKTEEIR